MDTKKLIPALNRLIAGDYDFRERTELKQALKDGKIQIVNATGERSVAVIGSADEIRTGDTYEITLTPESLEALISFRLVPMDIKGRATHFTNRTTELISLKKALRPGDVVTLHGTGGIGKTALAIEAIWQMTDGGSHPPNDFPDGVIFHSFYNQPSSIVALEYIASCYKETPNLNPVATAQRALSGKRALIVLDGAEVADRLDDVLAVCGQCGVLVTTRVSSVSQGISIHPLPQNEALILLKAWALERASNNLASRRICDLVGGLPLAVRLAGKFMSEQAQQAEEYLEWLEKTPLEALDHGNRQIESVPVLLDKSLAQVSTNGHLVMSIVGLLAFSPFTVECIEAGLGENLISVRRVLGELVRYGILERLESLYQVSHALIRTYARERFDLPTTILEKIANHYFMMGLKANKADSDGYQYWDEIREHYMAVLQRLEEVQAWDAINTIASEIISYLKIQGHWTELLSVCQLGIKATEKMSGRKNTAKWLGRLGDTKRLMGKASESIKFLEEAIAISREYGDKTEEASYLISLSDTYRHLGNTRKVVKCSEQALSISQETGNRRLEAISLIDLGGAYKDIGDLPKAIEYTEKVKVILTEINDKGIRRSFLSLLAAINMLRGNFQEAVTDYLQCLAISQELNEKINISSAYGNLGFAYSHLGKIQEAIKYYNLNIDLAIEIGDRVHEAIVYNNLGNAYDDLNDDNTAIAYYKKALNIAREIGYRRDESGALSNLGNMYYKQKDFEHAREYFENALKISQEVEYKDYEAIQSRNLGNAYYSLGNFSRACKFYEQSAKAYAKLGVEKATFGMCRNSLSSLAQLGNMKNLRRAAERIAKIIQAIPDSSPKADFLNSVGVFISMSGDNVTAMNFYRRALEMSIKIKNKKIESGSLSNIGKAHYDNRQFETAHEYFEKALAISIDDEDNEYKAIQFLNLGNACGALHNYKKARELYERAAEIYASIGDKEEELKSRSYSTEMAKKINNHENK